MYILDLKKMENTYIAIIYRNKNIIAIVTAKDKDNFAEKVGELVENIAYKR